LHFSFLLRDKEHLGFFASLPHPRESHLKMPECSLNTPSARESFKYKIRCILINSEWFLNVLGICKL